MTAPRSSHPSHWRPDAGRLLARMEDELRRREAPWPDVGASALVARALTGAGVEEWAQVTGVAAEWVRRTEAGAVEAGDVPAPLARRCHTAAVLPRRTDPEEPT